MSTKIEGPSQVDYWNGAAAERWTQHQERLDRCLLPLDQAGLQCAEPRAGEHVIDIGCGCGASSLALASAVGPRGSVLGVDVSGPMLARARERAREQPWVSFLEADAGSCALPADRDLIYSRVGIMFFEQPDTAFANLRRALRPGGRLCFVCWRSARDNAWQTIPLRAAAQYVTFPAPPPAGSPGPFALESEAYIRRLLTNAGFSDLTIEARDFPLTLSESGVADAVDYVTQAVGPVSRMMAELSDEQRAKVLDAIGTALSPHADGDRIALNGSVWVVRAR